MALQKILFKPRRVISDLIERLVLLLPRSHIEVRRAAMEARCSMDAGFVNRHQPFRLRIRQRLKKNLVDHGEHGGRRSNAERECCHYGHRELKSSP
jgi:hypothetical protein